MSSWRLIVAEMIPALPPYGRQLFICTNGNCASAEKIPALLRRLATLNREQGLHQLSNPHRIAHTTCGCLGVCTSGPILVIYPDGIWYHQVDELKLERIYREHLLAGRPVEEYIFHRHYPPGQEPAYAPDLRQDDEPDPLQMAAEQAAAEQDARRQAEINRSVPAHVLAARERRRQRRQARQTGEG